MSKDFHEFIYRKNDFAKEGSKVLNGLLESNHTWLVCFNI